MPSRGKRLQWVAFACAAIFLPSVSAAQLPAVRAVDLTASDGVALKASYFAAAKPGPGVLLLHQGNRDRTAWSELAGRLAAAGIHALTVDMRGFGESGGTPHDQLPPREEYRIRQEVWPGDIDAAWTYLVSQPGVRGKVIGIGGAGWDGVDAAVQTARRHRGAVKSLVLLSGETFLPGLRFLHEASEVPELFAVADDDEYPPTEAAMELLYSLASSPGKRWVHYAGPKVPWLGLEDVPGVAATGRHGTDLFETHPALPGLIADWYVATLIRTPGRAPKDRASAVPCAPILARLKQPGGVAAIARLLAAARQRDPAAQLFPETPASILGNDYLRAGETKAALALLKLVATAYPDSADANDSLSDAYLADGQTAPARHYAEQALHLLSSDDEDSPALRELIRNSAEKKLQRLAKAEPSR